MTDNMTIFVSAVRSHSDIPDPIKSCAESVIELVETTFDKTYFEYLDEQIKLCPRGPEWNKILQARKDTLSAFCNKKLLRGRIQYKSKDYLIRVDPKNESVVHWEECENKEWIGAVKKSRNKVSNAAKQRGMNEDEAESAADVFERATRKGLAPKESETMVIGKIKEGKKGKELSVSSAKETEKYFKDKDKKKK